MIGTNGYEPEMMCHGAAFAHRPFLWDWILFDKIEQQLEGRVSVWYNFKKGFYTATLPESRPLVNPIGFRKRRNL